MAMLEYVSWLRLNFGTTVTKSSTFDGGMVSTIDNPPWMVKYDAILDGEPPMGVSENSVALNPMVLLIIIPIKWLFHWEYTQHFQTNPYDIPCFRTKPWILVTSSRAHGLRNQKSATLQELRLQVLRQLRWLVRWGAWKLSENLGTLWWTNIAMENGDL